MTGTADRRHRAAGGPVFRSALLEQLGGDSQLEGAITTDICGKSDAHAVRLDQEADEAIRKARLHQKAATAIFFECNGGAVRQHATLPEVRLAIGEPGSDIGNVETVLESLSRTCFFLSTGTNQYRFSLSPNLNKIIADRRATIKATDIEERVRKVVQESFKPEPGVDVVCFPESSGQIQDRPVLQLVVLPPGKPLREPGTPEFIDQMTREHGSSARTFKSSLIWLCRWSAALMKAASCWHGKPCARRMNCG